LANPAGTSGRPLANTPADGQRTARTGAMVSWQECFCHLVNVLASINPSLAQTNLMKMLPTDLIKEASLLSQGKDYFITRNGKRYAGIHLIIDLYGASHLSDIAYVEKIMRRCIEASRATLLHIHLHRFDPDGISGVAVLAESHISVHTWPESRYAAFDVFMCGDTHPEACVDIMREAFEAEHVDVQEILRGEVDD
jgi:S-adenosylmethionine decarboxylase